MVKFVGAFPAAWNDFDHFMEAGDVWFQTPEGRGSWCVFCRAWNVDNHADKNHDRKREQWEADDNDAFNKFHWALWGIETKLGSKLRPAAYERLREIHLQRRIRNTQILFRVWIS